MNLSLRWTILQIFALATALLCVAVAQQQQTTPDRTVSYFLKNDPMKHDAVITAFANEPECATVDVNMYDDLAWGIWRSELMTDPRHETWWLVASPKEYKGYKKYRYIYVLEPPGTLTEKDIVMIVQTQTARGVAQRVCSQVTGWLRGARIH